MIELVNPESVGISSERLGRLRGWLEAQVTGERLAGASVLVGRRGGVAFFECAGMADQARARPFAQRLHEMDPELKRRIYECWQTAFERFGYPADLDETPARQVV